MAFTVEINQESSYPSIILKDDSTGCFAEVYALGALLNAFHIPTPNGFTNIIDGFASVEEGAANTTNGFKSSKLSPFVCRMKEGKYSFNLNIYKVEKFYLEPHAIHGLIYDLPYNIIATEVDNNFAQVTLKGNYDGFDKGYPFPFSITIIWKLEKNNSISVTTEIENNYEYPILYADGWHPYFTLGGTIDSCTLMFDSTTMIEFDETLIPTKNKIDDFRFINGQYLANIELDNCFELNGAKHPICILKNNALQLTISPDATYPFLQIYTPPHRKSIAIENLSSAPDAFNNKMGLLLLEPNKKYSFTTTYAVQNLK
jgi:aldose 1-epimerase